MTNQPNQRNKRPMAWRFLLLLAIMLVLLVFVVQNAGEVEVRFFRLRTEVSLSLVLFISFFIGAIGAVLVSLPAYFRRK